LFEIELLFLLVRTIKFFYMTEPIFHIDLDYPLSSNPRYEFEKNPHPELLLLLAGYREHYRSTLISFSKFSGQLARIPLLPPSIQLSDDDLNMIPERYEKAFNGDQEAIAWFLPIASEVSNSVLPCWLNGFIPSLDAVALYSFIVLNKPRNYIEVGSGNSTKFVRQAISDHGLNTKIISVDPNPRASIDAICDEIIRASLEESDLSVFDRLCAGDMLFVDGSHRCLMNSDATVFFLEVLPRLPQGVFVGIHDIFLPFDYPRPWVNRAYSEQYLLACYLLANSNRFRIEFPGFYIGIDKELDYCLQNLWKLIPNAIVKNGFAFWFRT
jgi:Methyltransferase domain